LVGLTHDLEPNRTSGSYAAYLVHSWTLTDLYLREVTIYYTLSVEHPPYNTQLLRSRLRGL
jgi:hypothetical protein